MGLLWRCSSESFVESRELRPCKTHAVDDINRAWLFKTPGIMVVESTWGLAGFLLSVLELLIFNLWRGTFQDDHVPSTPWLFIAEVFNLWPQEQDLSVPYIVVAWTWGFPGKNEGTWICLPRPQNQHPVSKAHDLWRFQQRNNNTSFPRARLGIMPATARDLQSNSNPT